VLHLRVTSVIAELKFAYDIPTSLEALVSFMLVPQHTKTVMNRSPVRYYREDNIIPTVNMLVPQHMFFGAILDVIEILLRTRNHAEYRYGHISSDNIKKLLYSPLRYCLYCTVLTYLVR
jgi:hypothetical protein